MRDKQKAKLEEVQKNIKFQLEDQTQKNASIHSPTHIVLEEEETPSTPSHTNSQESSFTSSSQSSDEESGYGDGTKTMMAKSKIRKQKRQGQLNVQFSTDGNTE